MNENPAATVRVRKRGHRYVIDDDGSAVAKAGRPPGWLAVARQVVDAYDLNVNRRGVVFVPAVEGGLDVDWLVGRVAECSAALYQELLEFDGRILVMVAFTLDGRPVSAPEGELLVHAAARYGVAIPTLCHDDKLDPYGGCRMCVVDVEGSPRPLPACATRVAEGMVVSTNSAVPQYRKTLTEMLLAEHLNPNPGGRPNELLEMAEELGAEAPFVLPDAKREPYEDRNKLMGYEPDTCILCNRCVRYTQEVMQCSALSLEGRGPEARIVPTHGYSWLDTECELCGGCLSTCPTGAIYEKFLEGTPTPERALTKVKSTCTYCGVGCQVDLNVDPETNKIVKVTSDPSYVSNEGNLCVKGRFAFNFVHHPDRLADPLVRGEDGVLHPTTWEHALQVAAQGLKEVKERHGPQSIGLLASARLTMEENFLLQKLARTALGTNSIHSCEAT